MDTVQDAAINSRVDYLHWALSFTKEVVNTAAID